MSDEYRAGWNAALDAIIAKCDELWICSNDYEEAIQDVAESLKKLPEHAAEAAAAAE
jgi:hypothetical protein